jgi:hypothetical protein
VLIVGRITPKTMAIIHPLNLGRRKAKNGISLQVKELSL